MPGVVKGMVMVDVNDCYAVVPDECAVEDEHRTHQPLCYRTYPDGEFRACPYWMSTTAPGNYTNRLHPSGLHQLAIALAARTTSCQIVCAAQRRNRPPGV